MYSFTLINTGGAVEVKGNAPNNSEYNFHIDPDSAAFVLKNCHIPIEMFGLEVANENAMTQSQHEQFISLNSSVNMNFEKGNNLGLLTDQIDQLVDICPKILISEIIKTSKEAVGFDSVVAYYIMNPSAFVLKHIDISVHNSTGRTTATLEQQSESGSSNEVGSIKIQLASEFKKNEYLTYLSSLYGTKI
jgi:inosine-uridine nucleoside N-ribohydrolase